MQLIAYAFFQEAPPEHARVFGAGASESNLTPIVLVAMVLALGLILTLGRKYIIVPLLLITFLVPLGQSVVIGGMHLFVCRLVILAGCLRLALSPPGETGGRFAGGFNGIDKAFLWSTVLQAIAALLLFRDGQAIINQGGFLLDSLGGYFLLRFLIRDEQDVLRLIKCLAILSVVLGAFMLHERLTDVNLFGYIGGSMHPDIRDGKVRAQAVFEHALLAGAFGSTLLCPFFILYRIGKSKLLAFAGIVGATIMTIASHSSTALLTYASCIVAAAFWPMRNKMSLLRKSIIVILIGLQCVMSRPVWFILARIDLTGGSSGYHRAELIDQFVRHFFDWCLIGVKDTGSWGWGLWDAQNQFVSVGENGGLAAFIFFIILIIRCFRNLGQARKMVEGDPDKELLVWLVGGTLLSHMVCFFGVNYFDQTKMLWFAALAMVTAVTSPILQKQTAEAIAGVKSVRLSRLSPTSSREPRFPLHGGNRKLRRGQQALEEPAGENIIKK